MDSTENRKTGSHGQAASKGQRRPLGPPPPPATARQAYFEEAAARSISSWPRRMEHQSLCSATGMPHSTQTCTRFLGSSPPVPNRRLSNDMALNTLEAPARFPGGWRKIRDVPIYDFQCRKCGHEFEAVVRPPDPPECPACQSRELEKRLSSFAVSSPEKKRAVADRQVKKAASDERRVQHERDAHAEKHRHEEH